VLTLQLPFRACTCLIADIINLPNEVLATPMGQMLRPMLEQMTAELNGADPLNGNAAAAAPSAAATAAAAARHVPTPVLAHHPAVPVAQGTTGDAPAGHIYTLLSSHTKPLLSADASIAATVLKRLQTTAAAALTSDDVAVLTQLQKALQSGLSAPLPDSTYTVLTKVLTQCDAAEFLVLCLLRLAVLHPTATSAQHSELLAAVEAVAQRLAVPKGAGFKSPQGLAMGLCTCANMFATSSGTAIMTSPAVAMPRCFDAALEALQHARVDVRQLAAALTFNYALALTSSAAVDSAEMSDEVTQLLLSSIEGLSDEADDLVALRRLMTAGCIMRKYTSACTELIEACDLGHHVMNYHQVSPATGKAKHVAAEIVQLLNSS
jgi:PUL domain